MMTIAYISHLSGLLGILAYVLVQDKAWQQGFHYFPLDGQLKKVGERFDTGRRPVVEFLHNLNRAKEL